MRAVGQGLHGDPARRARVGLVLGAGGVMGGAWLTGGALFRLERALPPVGPGSWRLALKTLRSPREHGAGAFLCAWLPRGIISTAPLKDTIRRAVPTGWGGHAP